MVAHLTTPGSVRQPNARTPGAWTGRLIARKGIEPPTRLRSAISAVGLATRTLEQGRRAVRHPGDPYGLIDIADCRILQLGHVIPSRVGIGDQLASTLPRDHREPNVLCLAVAQGYGSGALDVAQGEDWMWQARRCEGFTSNGQRGNRTRDTRIFRASADDRLRPQRSIVSRPATTYLTSLVRPEPARTHSSPEFRY